jgi:hypothetical protein
MKRKELLGKRLTKYSDATIGSVQFVLEGQNVLLECVYQKPGKSETNKEQNPSFFVGLQR